MSLLEETIYDERFQKASPDIQQRIINDVKQEYLKHADFDDVEMQKFDKQFNAKEVEYKSDMGINYSIPPLENQFNKPITTKQEAYEASNNATLFMQNYQAKKQLEAMDQPLEDTTLDFAFALGGATKAGQGLISKPFAKTVAQKKIADKSIAGGLAFAKGDIAGNVVASGAVEGVDALTTDEFKREHPLTSGLLQISVSLAAGGYAGYKAEKSVIDKYNRLAKGVIEGKVPAKEAEEALKNENFNPDEFLQKTKPIKASEELEFTQGNNPEIKIADETNITPEADNLEERYQAVTHHDRYNELLKMRKNVSAKDSQSPQRQVSKGGYRELNGNNGTDKHAYDYAQNEHNPNYDFYLTKQDIKKLQNGQYDDDLVTKLEMDLDTLDNHPDWVKTEDPKMSEEDWNEANMLFSKGIDNVAVGTYAGIDQDEDGNITFDPEKFLIGLGGYTAVKQALKNKKIQGVLKDYAQQAIEKVDFNPEVQKQGNSFNSMFAEIKNKGSLLDKSGRPDTKIQKPKGLIQRMAEQKKLAGLPEKGTKIYHPYREKQYYLGDSGTVYFERGNGQWREMPNEEIRSDIKFISENGVKKFREKNIENDNALKDAFADAEKKSIEDSYKMEHTAPLRDDANSRADDVSDSFSNDIYSKDAQRLHGHGNPKMDAESIEIINSVKGKPDSEVTIYRAIPDNVDAGINPKDWVTTSKEYAKSHGESVLKGNYKIIEAKVKAKDLYTDGNSIHEWGYDPITSPSILHANGMHSMAGSFAGGADALINQRDYDGDGEFTYKDLAYGAGAGALGINALKRISPSLFYEGLESGVKTGVFAGKKLKGIDEKNIHSFPDETKIQYFQRKIQDKFNRVKQLINNKANINEIDDALNPYQAEELYHGRVEAKIDKFDEEVVNPIMEAIADSKHSIDDVDEYLHARHAKERNAKMLELYGKENASGMSDGVADAILAKYADDEAMQNIANMVYKMNKDRLVMLYKSGLESEETIKGIESVYDNYVPLKRVMDDKKSFSGTGKGFDIKGKEFKRARGSDREVESPLMHSILSMQESIIRAEKNKVGKSMYQFMLKYPDSSIYEVKGLKHSPMYNKEGEVVGMNPNYKLDDNVFHVKVDGKIKEITFHDNALASAFKNLNANEMSSVMKVTQKVVRYLASINTQYNPEFVVSNFERDIQTAMINLPENIKINRLKMLKDVAPAIRGIYRQERGKSQTEWSKLFQELKDEGGTTGWLEQYDVKDSKAKYEKIIKEYNGEFMPKKAFEETLRYIDDINTAVENGVRLTAYKMAKESGLSNKKSASIAKNLTVNFNRKGEAGTALNTAYMFFNASIQGSARMVSALKNSKTARRMAGTLIAGSTGLSLYNMSQNRDAYAKIPQWEKDTNFIIMNEDGTYYKVKVPYGYNTFKTMGDVVAEGMNGELEGKDMPSRVMSAAVNAFSPIGTAPTFSQLVSPTVVRPAVDLELNKNFMGGKIAPEGSPFSPNTKADAYNNFKSVNPTAKTIARGLNSATGGDMHNSGMIDISPETIEYLFETATGGLGKLISRTQTTISDSLDKDKKVDINKVPFARGVYAEPREKSERNKVYEMYKGSGTKIYNDRESKRFKKWAREAFKAGDLDAKAYKKIVLGFNKNQNIKKWAKKWNVTSYAQVKKDKRIVRDAIKSRIPLSEIKKYYTEKD